MARKRATLKGKGPGIVKRGQGVDALFGEEQEETGAEVESTAVTETEAPAAPEGDEAALAGLEAEAEAAEPDAAAEAPAAPPTAEAEPAEPAEPQAAVAEAALPVEALPFDEVDPDAQPAPPIENLPSDEADLDLDRLLDEKAAAAAPVPEAFAQPAALAAESHISPDELPPAMEFPPPEELPPALAVIPPEALPPAAEVPPPVEELPAFEVDEDLAALAGEAGAAAPADVFTSQPPQRPLPAPPPVTGPSELEPAPTDGAQRFPVPVAPETVAEAEIVRPEPKADGAGIPATAYTVPPPASTLPAPPSTSTGAPSLSPRIPLAFEGPEDEGVFDFTGTVREVETAVYKGPERELTPEERAAKMKDAHVQEQLNDIYAAIDGEYRRILRANISVNKPITDWAHNLLAEARQIILDYQVEHLPRAEWNIEQVRARLDRAEESARQAKKFAWVISVWGLAWFFLFVGLIFRVDLVDVYLTAAAGQSDLLNLDIFLRTLFFGGIGGVTAVFYHLHHYVAARTYDPQYNLTYVAKPFMGMILGTLVYMIVFGLMGPFGIAPAAISSEAVTATGDASNVLATLFVWSLALAAGFKENLAFELLERIMKIIFRRRSDDEAEPSSAPPAYTRSAGEGT